MVKDHQLDSDQSVIVGPHIFDVAVDLGGHMAKLLELEFVGDETTRVGLVGTVPCKLMQPISTFTHTKKKKKNHG